MFLKKTANMMYLEKIQVYKIIIRYNLFTLNFFGLKYNKLKKCIKKQILRSVKKIFFRYLIPIFIISLGFIIYWFFTNSSAIYV